MIIESTIGDLPHSDVVSEAVKEVMSSACGMEVERCPNLPDDACQDGLAIAVIAIMGDIAWSIYLGFPRNTAEVLCEAFAGFEVPFESEDMGDAIGEVANILAGSIKSMLDKRGFSTEISLPSVMRVDGLHVLKQHGAQATKDCFTSSMGQFWTCVISGKSTELVI